MRSSRLCIAAVSLLIFFSGAYGQKKAKREPVKHEKEVRDMVAFLQFMLNTLGDATTASRDKDVLITESYTKVFRDAKVQVEDDLDENRNVITNKDVTAYLKDVDFFFKDVKFEFTIEDIKSEGAGDRLFYRVILTRNLTGTTIGGKKVNNTKPRYIEINYNAKDQDLKIVSIYTNQYNEKKALLSWWKELSYEWQRVLRQKFELSDSVSEDDLRKITAIENLDLSGNTYLQSLEPLSQLLDLRILNLSGTSIDDLSSIRNLTELAELDISNTRIDDISSIRYFNNLTRLNISQTRVDSIDVAEKLTKLQQLDLSNTVITDFQPLQYLTELQVLNLENTRITTLDPISYLSNLRELNVAGTSVNNLNAITALSNLADLNLEATRINDLAALSGLRNLKVLNVNRTAIADLDPLLELAQLERVYCDHTGINQQSASAFMASNPKVLVIFATEDLRTWWDNLPSVWRDVLSRKARINVNPSKEELARVTNLDSLNIANYISIKTLEPLQRLQKLKVIIMDHTGVTDLSPIKDHKNIHTLDISDTYTTDLSPLRDFARLKVLKADNSRVKNIDTLSYIPGLQKLFVDGTDLPDSVVYNFLQRNNECLIVYKTDRLESWWNGLSEDWKQVFQLQIKIDNSASREALHRLVELERIVFGDVPVNDLSPLTEFVRLKELRFSATAVSSLSPLADIQTLKILYANDNPIKDLTPVSKLKELQEIDISNTPVAALETLGALDKLLKMNCAGTQVKKLNALQKMKSLEYLDCSNTDVKSLSPVMGLPLKTLKCYNTKISSGAIKKFQKQNPSCNVVYYR
ncbi:leucine-rich repeat domain-containing protein [Chryseosolibacter indicus]|uniref:Leucine-rich repeat domain-containing protein n=1 Tax=Chryseosolibacter indicus TaxID=2782351 RepID=A0ABS5VSB9_9BACT|nr:leucine-rich repeat domain-containing protein [Chryseosolibacter indicus]MBT1702901.1 leucine-rich repeat domain-containing protein [Chryseosolibacter indicus]